MNTSKLGACLLAALITLGGATHLARPAEAAAAVSCSDEERAYAQGYANGYCQQYGMLGVVNDCQSGGGFSFYCEYPT